MSSRRRLRPLRKRKRASCRSRRWLTINWHQCFASSRTARATHGLTTRSGGLIPGFHRRPAPRRSRMGEVRQRTHVLQTMFQGYLDRVDAFIKHPQQRWNYFACWFRYTLVRATESNVCGNDVINHAATNCLSGSASLPCMARFQHQFSCLK